jgi:hypothetical protein
VPVLPEIRYAKSGDVSIAYQVVGEGELDLVWIPSLASPKHVRRFRAHARAYARESRGRRGG